MEQPRQLSTEVSMLPTLKETKIQIPEIQRDGQRWNLSQKRLLIDSIYNKYPIPPLYFREQFRESTVWWQIDGQQRLEAIIDFLSNKFYLAQDGEDLEPSMRGKYFKDLTNEQKGRILSRTIDYTVVVCDDDEEEKMFLRLNYGTPLTAAEIRNAIRGEFNDAAKKLAKHPFFETSGRITKSAFARDAYCAQTMLLASTTESTDIRDMHIRAAYRNNKIYTDRKKITGIVSSFFDKLLLVFPKREIYLVKHALHTYFILFRLMDQQGIMDQISNEKLFKFLHHFELERKHALASPDQYSAKMSKFYFHYDHLSRFGTDRGHSLHGKAQHLLKHLIETLNLKPVVVEKEEA